MVEIRISASQRQEVHQRARGCCEYCRSQVRFTVHSFTVDHIVPRSRGGGTELENLALSCEGCNAHKYNKTEGRDPASGEVVPLFHPRRDRWRDHFAWSDDFALVLGTTRRGRATVEMLHMNRDGVVNLRRLLLAMGQHPPTDLDASRPSSAG